MTCRPLSCDEREEIRIGIDRGESLAAIARRLQRRNTTISREVKRNGGRNRYVAVNAQRRADRCTRRPKQPKLVTDRALAKTVEADLHTGFSPAAITARLRQSGGPCVVAETIYQALYSKRFRGLTLLPAKCLRSRRMRRNPYRRTQAIEVRKRWTANIKLVEHRPEPAATRTESGHWEGDLVVGAGNASAVVTLIERQSRYTLLGLLPNGHSAPAVATTLIALLQELPRCMRRSLTWDQGRELIGNWAPLEEALAIEIYFCHPHSPWQRPSNEHLNRQLRFWLPKRTNLNTYNQNDLDTITNVLNNQPRKLFNWDTPAQRYSALTMH